MNKKAIIPVIAVVLILAVSITAFTVFYFWFMDFTANMEIKMMGTSQGNIEILQLETYEYSLSRIAIRNIKEDYHIINFIELSDTNCELLSGNVIPPSSTRYYYLNCPSTIRQVYTVNIITNKGVYTKDLRVNN